jgi:transposase
MRADQLDGPWALSIRLNAMTPWIVHELRNLGFEVVCLDATHARAALKMQINKNDKMTPRD